MSEFAQPAAPIRRLFFRIDLAAQPQSLALRRVLKHWQSQRGADVYPSQGILDADALGSDRAHVFAFNRAEDDDFGVRFSGKVLEELLGPIEQGDLLSNLKARRSAAILRRLFRLIELRGEPLVAGFEARLPDAAPSMSRFWWRRPLGITLRSNPSSAPWHSRQPPTHLRCPMTIEAWPD